MLSPMSSPALKWEPMKTLRVRVRAETGGRDGVGDLIVDPGCARAALRPQRKRGWGVSLEILLTTN